MKNNSLKKSILILLVLVFIFFNISIPGCTMKNSNPVFIVEMQGDFGTFEIEMFPDKAPNTVNRIIDLAKKDYYNNLPVYSVQPNLVVKMGGDDKNTKGYLFPEETSTTIKGEFKDNGFDKNDLIFEKGTVGLWLQNASEKDSGISDFFITLDRTENLDGKYAAFGKVVKGIEVVEKISNIKSKGLPFEYMPLDPPKINKTYLRLKGVEYPTPVTIKRNFDY